MGTSHFPWPAQAAPGRPATLGRLNPGPIYNIISYARRKGDDVPWLVHRKFKAGWGWIGVDAGSGKLEGEPARGVGTSML